MEPDEKQKVSGDNLFGIGIIVSFIPIINILYFIFLICLCFIYSKDYKQNTKEQKLHPEKFSLKILKEIVCLYNAGDSIVHYSEFIKTLEENINILETKCDTEVYKNLLLRYEFTFARIKSIIEESSNLKDIARNTVLTTSKELIDGFLKEFQQLLDKDNEIESETEKVILNRFMKELDEEKIIHSRRSQ
jgi:hypothetical protein